MMKLTTQIFILLLLFSSCANMVSPTGGTKDTAAPILVSISENKTASINEVHFIFNEYIQLNNWEENFYISPPFNKKSQKKIKGKTLIVSIKDSLTNNTTYCLSLSNSIKDLNEGNITDSLSFVFGNTYHFDTLTLSGTLQNAYTLKFIGNAWIMLFNQARNDSVIFKETPNYISKTDKYGNFHFPNLNRENYKIVSLTDFDFIYNKGEQIAFSDKLINAEQDSFISLFAFDPIVVVDSISNTLSALTDGSKTDSVLVESITYGNLEIITTKNSPCIFQLLQNEKVISQFKFSEQPYSLTDIIPGKYQLKFIEDADKNGEWTTGSWKNKIQAERGLNYPEEITIRSNWDLELEWDLE
ncbi:Ig-like domain-containing protein [Flavobacteriales bacterium]|nr:Ig-like domain-containing protein [Flavobacteriales bacterium]